MLSPLANPMIEHIYPSEIGFARLKAERVTPYKQPVREKHGNEKQS